MFALLAKSRWELRCHISVLRAGRVVPLNTESNERKRRQLRNLKVALPG